MNGPETASAEGTGRNAHAVAEPVRTALRPKGTHGARAVPERRENGRGRSPSLDIAKRTRAQAFSTAISAPNALTRMTSPTADGPQPPAAAPTVVTSDAPGAAHPDSGTALRYERALAT